MRRLVLPLEDKVSIVPALEDEAVPRSPTGRRGIASSLHGKMRQRLVLPLKDKAAPRPRSGRQGGASSPCKRTRRHLVLPLEDKAIPRCLVPDSGQSVYRYLIEPERTTRERKKTSDLQ
ncbi:hypothetical protein GW17_00052030 [Ensete ventricosum]|nr:hypothetical protein GW17_00052030 [Ensete ventricosum]